MAGDSLHHLGDVDEIQLAFRRGDGSAGSTPVWIVRVGDDVFVRSMKGPGGGWYRRLRAEPDSEVMDEDHTHEVRAEPVTDPATISKVTRAYQAKYADSPFLEPFLNDETANSTLRLQPR